MSYICQGPLIPDQAHQQLLNQEKSGSFQPLIITVRIVFNAIEKNLNLKSDHIFFYI